MILSKSLGAQVKRFKLFVNEEYCKGCRICVHFCPRDAIRLSDDFNSKGVNVPVPSNMEKCTGCRICEFYCPDFAIAIAEDEGSNCEVCLG